MWNRTRPAGLVLGVTLLAGIALGRMGLQLSEPVLAQDVPADDVFPAPAKSPDPAEAGSITDEPFGLEPAAPSLEPMPTETPKAVTPDDANATLRQELLELTQQRANLLTAEQLEQAVDKARSSLLITQAEQELEECLERLEQVAQKYPNTAAGLRAKGLLQQGRDPSMLAPAQRGSGFESPSPFRTYPSNNPATFNNDSNFLPTPVPRSSPFSNSVDPADPFGGSVTPVRTPVPAKKT